MVAFHWAPGGAFIFGNCLVHATVWAFSGKDKESVFSGRFRQTVNCRAVARFSPVFRNVQQRARGQSAVITALNGTQRRCVVIRPYAIHSLAIGPQYSGGVLLINFLVSRDSDYLPGSVG